MTVNFTPSRPRGHVEVPPSKSRSHRALICAAAADGTSHIDNLSDCEDCLATEKALRSLGAEIRREGRLTTVVGHGFPELSEAPFLPCGESASTFRMLLPLAVLRNNKAIFQGSSRLIERVLPDVADFCHATGAVFAQTETILTVTGKLTPGELILPAGGSSQLVSGLLMALPFCGEDSRLTLSSPPVSRPYIDMTKSELSRFGVAVNVTSPTSFLIPGRQTCRPTDMTVEGDYSAAVPFFFLAALGEDVSVDGLSAESVQGDKVAFRLLSSLSRKAADIDLSDIPDLAPCLFAMAAVAHGGHFSGIARLRRKETDRVACMERELSAFGAAFSYEGKDSLAITPGRLCAPERPLSSHGDHRIAMALSSLLSLTGGTLSGAACVSKSFPGFFDALSALEVSFSVIH